MHPQLTLSAADWYVEYNKSLDDFDRDFAAYNHAYTHQVRVELSSERYADAMVWLTHTFGPEDADSLNDHVFRSRWCRFHPTTDGLMTEEGERVTSLFGFKNASDAVLFKLSWWH